MQKLVFALVLILALVGSSVALADENTRPSWLLYEHFGEIYVAEVQSNTIVNLTEDLDAPASQPYWSRDGKFIIFNVGLGGETVAWMKFGDEDIYFLPPGFGIDRDLGPIDADYVGCNLEVATNFSTGYDISVQVNFQDSFDLVTYDGQLGQGNPWRDCQAEPVEFANSVCGNGVCDAGEDVTTCSLDCSE